MHFPFFPLNGANCITLRRENTSFLFVPILTVRLSLVVGGGTQHLFLPSFLLPNCGVRSQKKLFLLPSFWPSSITLNIAPPLSHSCEHTKEEKEAKKVGENAVVGKIKAEKTFLAKSSVYLYFATTISDFETETLNNYRENGELKGKAAATKPRIFLLPRWQKHLAFANTYPPPFAV